MRYRKAARLPDALSEIGYGMWGMGGWSGSDDAESARALDRAVELGCTFFDTAAAYGDGHSERLLGDLLRRYRDVKLVVGIEGSTEEPPMAWARYQRRGRSVSV